MLLTLLSLMVGGVVTVNADATGEREEESQPHRLEDIVVSVAKMKTNVAKTPTNIAVISRDEIEKFPGSLDFSDLLRRMQLPGVYISQMPTSIPSDGRFSTRGGANGSMTVRILVNGIEFNQANGSYVPPRIPLNDIERIEIIKTPSAVYGDQAIGGVINVITRESEKYLEAKAGISMGGFGTKKGYSVINGREGKWHYFLDAGLTQYDSYQYGAYEDDTTIYAKARYDLTDTASITFHGSHWEYDGNYANPLTMAQFEADPRQNPGIEQPVDTNMHIGAFVFEKSFANSELLIKFDYKDEECELFWQEMWFSFDEFEAHPEVSFTHRHRIGSMDNKIVVGAEYRYHEIDSLFFLAPENVVGTQLTDRHREDTSYAFYLQDELCPTHALTITGALRYDEFEQEQEDRLSPSDGWSDSNSAISPIVGATYQFSDAVNLFAGFNSGFKSPARVSAAAASAELDPERFYSYEIGIRGNAAAWLSYELALFYNEIEDKIVRTGTQEYDNAGKTRSTGVELGVRTNFQNGVYSAIGYTYQDSEYADYTIVDESYNDKKLPNIPNQTFGAWIGYRNDIWGDFSINPTYTGEMYLNDTNTLQWDSYWLFNAKYSKRFVDWKPNVEFFISGENLTDEKEISYNYTNSAEGAETFFPVFGRCFFASASVAF